ncbi:unnamed protein product [Soboliphyme baturini]|uniref:Uncharacterized protein n=1 Tax=Soboliphyme baturini TaxID=241478 RepID=A0A183IH24_9BILA|nr:unnamed protein product [Soboliphyme baturini]
MQVLPTNSSHSPRKVDRRKWSTVYSGATVERYRRPMYPVARNIADEFAPPTSTEVAGTRSNAESSSRYLEENAVQRSDRFKGAIDAASPGSWLAFADEQRSGPSVRLITSRRRREQRRDWLVSGE